MKTAGIVDDPIATIYKRSLRNYDETFRAINLQIKTLLDRSAQVKLQTAAVEAEGTAANPRP